MTPDLSPQSHSGIVTSLSPQKAGQGAAGWGLSPSVSPSPHACELFFNSLQLVLRLMQALERVVLAGGVSVVVNWHFDNVLSIHSPRVRSGSIELVFVRQCWPSLNATTGQKVIFPSLRHNVIHLMVTGGSKNKMAGVEWSWLGIWGMLWTVSGFGFWICLRWPGCYHSTFLLVWESWECLLRISHTSTSIWNVMNSKHVQSFLLAALFLRGQCSCHVNHFTSFWKYIGAEMGAWKALSLSSSVNMTVCG